MKSDKEVITNLIDRHMRCVSIIKKRGYNILDASHQQPHQDTIDSLASEEEPIVCDTLTKKKYTLQVVPFARGKKNDVFSIRVVLPENKSCGKYVAYFFCNKRRAS